MKYYLAVDSGGTKVQAILYDENFHPVKSCRVGSMRDNTTPEDIIWRNLKAFTDTLSLQGMTLGRVSGVWFDVLKQELNRICTVESFVTYGERNAGLTAAGIKGDGYCAIVGTGASLSCQWNGRAYGSGGYGSFVADEGSGYWIGREAMGAAIRDFEQRGKHTMLTDLIAEHFHSSREDLRNAIFNLYRWTEHSPVTWVASCAPLVSRAALSGDPVAYDILERAGKVLGEQMASLPRCFGTPKSLPITVSGSVWRGHPVILSEFSNVLKAAGMEHEVILPEFEPIVGIILGHYFETHEALSSEDHLMFRELYQNYLFQVTS